jgi:tripartite-type tricarboxylate transporter receptor subunit TctC
MQRQPRTVTAILAALLVATSIAAGARAQGWPSRFITIVVSFPAGGPTDVLARAIAAELADKLGQQVVVENRSGAGGNVGAASEPRPRATATRSSSRPPVWSTTVHRLNCIHKFE